MGNIEVQIGGPTQPTEFMTQLQLTQNVINLQKNVNRSTTELPTNLTIDDKGYKAFNSVLNIPVWWNGRNWIDANGFTPDIHKGTSSNRPVGYHSVNPAHTIFEGTLRENYDVGYNYFDTTLGKMIYAKQISYITGEVTWIDANGDVIDD